VSKATLAPLNLVRRIEVRH